jgi:predicted PhzF superfamily epimerase YddE/YHI9
MPVVSQLPETISNALNIPPKEVYKARDYLLLYDTQKEIEEIKINRHMFDKINLNPGGVIVTAKGENCDFVSRFFTPQASILEDPVTGSAHCSLTPFWSSRLKKNQLYALQISDRGGTLQCQNKKDRVLISGKAKTYSIGTLWTQ